MLTPDHDLFKALTHARRAMRSGDPAAAERWMRIAERHLGVYQRLNQMADAPPHEQEDKSHKLPVMLDPDGFSPSGIPNWSLAQQRLEWAGLRKADAKKLWKEQQERKK